MCPDPCATDARSEPSFPTSPGLSLDERAATIRAALAAFFLSQETDRSCTDVPQVARVLAFLEYCVDNHGYRNLTVEERIHYESEYAAGLQFADIFSPQHLLYELDFFCARFFKEDVVTSEATEKAAVQVVLDLKRFLVREGLVSRNDVLRAELHSRRQKALMPRARRARRLVSEASRPAILSGQSQMPCDDHLVIHVGPRVLQVLAFPEGGSGTACAVEVPDEVLTIVKEGWCVCAGLASCGDRWRFVDIQSMYPGPRPS